MSNESDKELDLNDSQNSIAQRTRSKNKTFAGGLRELLNVSKFSGFNKNSSKSKESIETDSTPKKASSSNFFSKVGKRVLKEISPEFPKPKEIKVALKKGEVEAYLKRQSEKRVREIETDSEFSDDSYQNKEVLSSSTNTPVVAPAQVENIYDNVEEVRQNLPVIQSQNPGTSQSFLSSAVELEYRPLFSENPQSQEETSEKSI